MTDYHLGLIAGFLFGFSLSNVLFWGWEYWKKQSPQLKLEFQAMRANRKYALHQKQCRMCEGLYRCEEGWELFVAKNELEDAIKELEKKNARM